jgi:peptidyl-prolyl isomerase E (cyclophilin E)
MSLAILNEGVEYPVNVKRTLFVGGLADEVDEAVLRSAFIPFGKILDIALPSPGNLYSDKANRYRSGVLCHRCQSALDSARPFLMITRHFSQY